jgi:outer membrane protein
MVKQKVLGVFAAVLMAAAPGVVSAQSSDGVKIGVVNVDFLLQQSPQSAVASQKLEDEFAPRNREISSLQTALEEKAAQIRKDLEVMGAEERENAQRDIRNDERAIVRAQNELREDFDLRRNEAIGQIQNDILREISEYGKTESYDLIMVSGIVHVSEKIDITALILERLKSAPGVADAG